MFIAFRILIMILLLYPIVLGFYFGTNKPTKKNKITYVILAVLLALTNLVVAVATYTGAFISDSWFNFGFFFAFEIGLLVASVAHIVMLVNKKYNHKLISIYAFIILAAGLGFSISLMIFSNPESTTGDGLSFTNALLTLLPTLSSTALFALFGSDKKTF